MSPTTPTRQPCQLMTVLSSALPSGRFVPLSMTLDSSHGKSVRTQRSAMQRARARVKPTLFQQQ
jgi:hypothetical protein